VLGKVITARELFAALVTLEWLIFSVKGSVVALKMFLSSESAVADLTDKCLGWVFSKRLLAASSIDRLVARRVTSIRTHDTVGSVMLG
jgi:hypothetical protein